jgi:DNA-binding NarL/FixJ family response regulator
MGRSTLMNERKDQDENNQTRKRVLIVDDHPVVREGLMQFINQEPDLVVCAEAESAKQALKIAERQQIDLAVVDMLLRNTTGIQVTKELKSKYPNLFVLILSMSNDTYYVINAFQAGARGYITKDEVSEKIIDAIRQVLKGNVYLSEKLAKKFSKVELDRLLGTGA